MGKKFLYSVYIVLFSIPIISVYIVKREIQEAFVRMTDRWFNKKIEISSMNNYNEYMTETINLTEGGYIKIRISEAH